jgi:hypothetical protein
MQNQQEEPNPIKKKPKNTLWIVLAALAGLLCVGLAAAGVVLVFGGMILQNSADLSEYGLTTRQNPIALGETHEYEGLVVAITNVDTTTYTEDRQYHSLDAYRVFTEGWLTCTRPEGESCLLREVDVYLSLSDTALDMRSEDLDEGLSIEGGQSAAFRLYTTKWLSKEKEHLPGSVIKLRVQQEGQAAPHTMWFDTGYE